MLASTGIINQVNMKFGFKLSAHRLLRSLSALLLLLPLLVSGARELSLDGTWEIAFDENNAGQAAEWHKDAVFTNLDERLDIAVPMAWECIKQDYEGVAYYRKAFRVPKAWDGRVVHLRFGAVNYIAEVFLNDEPVGMHEGGFTPFDLNVTTFIKPGQMNILTLRVEGPLMLSDKTVDGIGAAETPQWRGGLSAGIWQSVKLETTGAAFVEDVQVIPDWSTGEVSFNIKMEQTATASVPVKVRVRIRESGTKESVEVWAKVVDLPPGVHSVEKTLKVKEFQAWSPDDPFLYEATISLHDNGKKLDTWESRFGFREFTIKDNDFYLNGERIYLRATFFEGLYPNGIAAPDSEEMIRREITLAKEAGFNMIRPWRRPPVPQWLDLADEMGVLVVGSPVVECMGYPSATPHLTRRVENEIRETVLRDRNRTSIVQWELFNELHRPILKQMLRPMSTMVRDLDPTRLILDESGGWAFGANMYLPGQYTPIQFNDIHTYPGMLVNKHLYDGFLTIGMTPEEKIANGFDARTPGRNVLPDLMSFVSELGYGSMPDLPANNQQFVDEGNPLTPAFRYHARLEEAQRRVLEESGFADLFEDFGEFCREQQSIHGASNKRMIEATRANPEVDGYCIHALTGGDWILGAGLIDLWRNPKGEAFTATKAANQPRIVSIRMLPRNVYAESGADLSVTGINDLAETEATLHVVVRSASGEPVMQRQVDLDWSAGVSNLLHEHMDTGDLTGAYTVEVSVKDPAGNTLTENTHDFDVFKPEELRVPMGQIALLDTEAKLSPFMADKGINFESFDEETRVSIPVFVVDIRLEPDVRETLFSFIERGGTAVYVGAHGMENYAKFTNKIQTQPVPVKGDELLTKGFWNCVSHVVKEHPIFDGLPVDGHMRELYANVWAKKSLEGLGGETIAAAIGYIAFSRENKLQYSGPGRSYWASDVAIVPYGSGRCVVTQLRLVDNLGIDPVADKLLYNLINFSTRVN